VGGLFTDILSGSFSGLGSGIVGEALSAIGLGNGYRPLQWSFQQQLVSITAKIPNSTTNVNATSVATQDASVGGFQGPNPGPPVTIFQAASPSQDNAASFQATTYFFDAVFRLEHVQDLRATEHPVQNGGAISDHAYLLPARVTLEVGFSDVMDSFLPGQYSGNSSKSVNAYQTFLNLQQMRIPLQLTTRLNTYTNMVIESIRAHDDIRSRYGLRATLILRQIFMGTVVVSQLSARPNQTNSSNPGASTPVAVPQNLQQYQNADGDWSSDLP
jgi:hypothetical protein